MFSAASSLSSCWRLPSPRLRSSSLRLTSWIASTQFSRYASMRGWTASPHRPPILLINVETCSKLPNWIINHDYLTLITLLPEFDESASTCLILTKPLWRLSFLGVVEYPRAERMIDSRNHPSPCLESVGTINMHTRHTCTQSMHGVCGDNSLDDSVAAFLCFSLYSLWISRGVLLASRVGFIIMANHARSWTSTMMCVYSSTYMSEQWVSRSTKNQRKYMVVNISVKPRLDFFFKNRGGRIKGRRRIVTHNGRGRRGAG